jgi:hypothetical protein
MSLRARIRSKTTNSIGMTKMPISDPASIPPNTGVPTARRLAAPAPPAIISGATPRMKAKLVIMTRRNLGWAAAWVSAIALCLLTGLLLQLQARPAKLAPIG